MVVRGIVLGICGSRNMLLPSTSASRVSQRPTFPRPFPCAAYLAPEKQTSPPCAAAASGTVKPPPRRRRNRNRAVRGGGPPPGSTSSTTRRIPPRPLWAWGARRIGRRRRKDGGAFSVRVRVGCWGFRRVGGTCGLSALTAAAPTPWASWFAGQRSSWALKKICVLKRGERLSSPWQSLDNRAPLSLNSPHLLPLAGACPPARVRYKHDRWATPRSSLPARRLLSQPNVCMPMSADGCTNNSSHVSTPSYFSRRRAGCVPSRWRSESARPRGARAPSSTTASSAPTRASSESFPTPPPRGRGGGGGGAEAGAGARKEG